MWPAKYHNKRVFADCKLRLGFLDLGSTLSMREMLKNKGDSSALANLINVGIKNATPGGPIVPAPTPEGMGNHV